MAGFQILLDKKSSSNVLYSSYLSEIRANLPSYQNISFQKDVKGLFQSHVKIIIQYTFKQYLCHQVGCFEPSAKAVCKD